jgi:Ferritin-like domain
MEDPMHRSFRIPRRVALMSLGATGVAAALRPSLAGAQTPQTAPTTGRDAAVTDAAIFNFALNLESLETEYYLRGTTGKGMDDADAGQNPGPVTGGRKVPWKNDDLREFMEEVAANELAHVRFYRKTLGAQAIARPAIDPCPRLQTASRSAARRSRSFASCT